MTKALVALVALVSLSGCATYLREQPDLPKTRKDLPKECVELYKHTTGDDASSDEFAGIYCKVDEPQVDVP